MGPTTFTRSVWPALRIHWAPAAVLALGILGTVLAAYSVALMSNSREKLRFRNNARWMEGLIRERLDIYVSVLNSTAAMFSIHEQPTAEEFRAYAQRLALAEHFPGAQGVGFARRTVPEEIDRVTTQMRADYGLDLRLTPPGPREVLYPIVYLEPRDRRNLQALGYDMFSEPVRQAAMIRARDGGRAAASGKVTLVQEIDADKRPGFLIYVPVYRGGVIPNTVEERRDRILGFVYSPFRAIDLFEGIYGSNPEADLHLEVYDGPEVSDPHLLQRWGPEASRVPTLVRTVPLEFAGHRWTLAFRTTPEFDAASYVSLVPWVLAAGMILTVALFGVTVALARAHRDLHQAQSDLRAHALKLEETVHARTAKLTEVIGELEHMSYSIVHDLRAPLRAIQGFGGILEEEAGPALSPTNRGYIERMKTAANRMDMLIQDVLSYGKLVEQDLPLATVDVVELIRGIIDTYPALQPAAAEIKISPAIPPVKANAAALTQCLANLLINAVKFVSPGQLPKVEVTAERRNGDVEICVADQGIGIPADLLERVFGMFQRAHNGYEGTGMGLAIVRKAAERMGGSVRVESQVNAGSRFYLRLKAA